MELINFVHYLDQVANKTRIENNTDNPEFQQIQFLSDREDALPLAQAIMQYAETDIVLFAGSRILNDIVLNKWDIMSPQDRLSFRLFAINTYNSLSPSMPVYGSIEKVLSAIAIKEFPENWPDFITSLILKEQPNFRFFSDFLSNLQTLPSITTQRYELIKSAIQSFIPEIIKSIIMVFPNFDSPTLLTRLIPYMTPSMINELASSPIFEINDNQLVQPLCQLLLSTEIHENLIRSLFNRLVLIITTSGIDESDSLSLISLMQQHLPILETLETIQGVQIIHQFFLSLDFYDSIEYWEYFMLLIYSDYKNGDNKRLNIHGNTIQTLMINTINNFPTPNDFLVYNENNNLIFHTSALYGQMKTLLLCLINTIGESAIQFINNAFEEISNNFTEMKFVSLVWVSATISLYKVNEEFIAKSLQFVYNVYISTQEKIAAICFIYLSMYYIKINKISNEMALMATQIAFKGLTIESTQKISTNFINTISKIMPQILAQIFIPQIIQDILSSSIFPLDIFTILSESICHIDLITQFDSTKIIAERWNKLQNMQISFEYTHELQIIISSLIGFSKVNSQCIITILNQILPTLQNTTQQFLNLIVEIYKNNGSLCKSRDDIQLMIGFMKNVTILLKETRYVNCQWVISLYSNLQPELRFPETLLLVEAILCENNIPKEVIQYIQNIVILPAEEMINFDKTLFMNHTILLPKVLYALISKHFEYIQPNDIETIISLLNISNTQIVPYVLMSIQILFNNTFQLQNCQTKETIMKQYFPKVLISLISVTCEPSYRDFFVDMINLCFEILEIIKKVEINLFNEIDNLNGIVNLIAQELCKESFVPFEEMIQMILILCQQNNINNFELLMVQIVSKTKQSSPAETLRHLQIQKTKNQIQIDLNTSIV